MTRYGPGWVGSPSHPRSPTPQRPSQQHTYLGIGRPDSTDELVGVDALRLRPIGQVHGSIARVGPPTIEHRAIDGLVDPRCRGFRPLVGSEADRAIERPRDETIEAVCKLA